MMDHKSRPYPWKPGLRPSPPPLETRPEAKSCIPFCLPFCPGLQAEFGTYKKYYEFVKKRENQDKHKQFLSERKEWVRQHDENPDKTRLLSKNDLQQATQLSTARTLGGKFVAPKMQFITKAGWDSSKHGEWDPAKVVKTVMFGEEKEGIWRKIGAESLTSRSTMTVPSRSPRSSTTAARAPLQSLLCRGSGKPTLRPSRRRPRLATPQQCRGQMSLFDLVAQIGSGAQSSGSAAKEPASGQGSAVAVDSSESGEADGSESGDSGDEDMTGMSFWGTTAKAKEPKAKPKPVAKVAAAPKGTGNSKNKRGAQGAKKCSRSEPASSTKGEEKESRRAAKKREGIQAPPLPISFTEPIAGMQLGPQV